MVPAVVAAALVAMATLVCAASAQCPWQRAVPALQTMCVCVVDDTQKLSIQASDTHKF